MYCHFMMFKMSTLFLMILAVKTYSECSPSSPFNYNGTCVRNCALNLNIFESTCSLPPSCKTGKIEDDTFKCTECLFPTESIIPNSGSCKGVINNPLIVEFPTTQKNYLSNISPLYFNIRYFKFGFEIDHFDLIKTHFLSLEVIQLQKYGTNYLYMKTIYRKKLEISIAESPPLFQIPKGLASNMNRILILKINLESFTSSESFLFTLKEPSIIFDLSASSTKLSNLQSSNLNINNLIVDSSSDELKVSTYQLNKVGDILQWTHHWTKTFIKADLIKGRSFPISPSVPNLAEKSNQNTKIKVVLETENIRFKNVLDFQIEYNINIEEYLRNFYLLDHFKNPIYYNTLIHLVSQFAEGDTFLTGKQSRHRLRRRNAYLYSWGLPLEECHLKCSKNGYCKEYRQSFYLCECRGSFRGRNCQLNPEIFSIISNIQRFFLFDVSSDNLQERIDILKIISLLDDLLEGFNSKSSLTASLSSFDKILSDGVTETKGGIYLGQKAAKELILLIENAHDRSLLLSHDIEGLFSNLSDFFAKAYFSQAGCSSLRAHRVILQCTMLNDIKDKKKISMGSDGYFDLIPSIESYLTSNDTLISRGSFIVTTKVTGYSNMQEISKSNWRKQLQSRLFSIGAYEIDGRRHSKSSSFFSGLLVVLTRDSSLIDRVTTNVLEDNLKRTSYPEYEVINNDIAPSKTYDSSGLTSLLKQLNNSLKFEESPFLDNFITNFDFNIEFPTSFEYLGDNLESRSSFRDNKNKEVYRVKPFTELKFYIGRSDRIEGMFMPSESHRILIYNAKIYEHYITSYYVGGSTIFLLCYLIMLSLKQAYVRDTINQVFLKKGIHLSFLFHLSTIKNTNRFLVIKSQHMDTKKSWRRRNFYSYHPILSILDIRGDITQKWSKIFIFFSNLHVISGVSGLIIIWVPPLFPLFQYIFGVLAFFFTFFLNLGLGLMINSFINGGM